MNNLSAFLSQNAIKVENIKYAASKRFLDEEKKPMEWEICCITSIEDETLRKSCTRQVQVPGKKNQFTSETDYKYDSSFDDALVSLKIVYNSKESNLKDRIIKL